MAILNFAYVATEDGKPIAVAHTMRGLEKILDDYFGVGANLCTRIGYFPNESKYPDDLDGKYQYRDNKETYEIKVYCTDYSPLSKEEARDQKLNGLLGG